jgi:hypothetical protein
VVDGLPFAIIIDPAPPGIPASPSCSWEGLVRLYVHTCVTEKLEVTVYYEYFRERAAAFRHSAEGADGWLSDVSLELANMYEEMAEASLTRELSQLYKPLASKVPKTLSHTRRNGGMPVGQGPFWRRMFFGRARWAPRFTA